jgi:hypothetical protein
MTKSPDGMTWTDIVGPGLFTSNPPVEISHGGVAAMGMNYVLFSADGGSTWAPLTSALPTTQGEDLHGMTYSRQRNAVYVWHNYCGSSGQTVVVPVDAIMRYDLN